MLVLLKLGAVLLFLGTAVAGLFLWDMLERIIKGKDWLSQFLKGCIAAVVTVLPWTVLRLFNNILLLAIGIILTTALLVGVMIALIVAYGVKGSRGVKG